MTRGNVGTPMVAVKELCSRGGMEHIVGNGRARKRSLSDAEKFGFT